MRCARRYFYTKVLKVDEPGSIYLDIGSIFHGVMQRVVPVGASSDELRALLETGDFVPPSTTPSPKTWTTRARGFGTSRACTCATW
jgi:hypothetical protein